MDLKGPSNLCEIYVSACVSVKLIVCVCVCVCVSVCVCVCVCVCLIAQYMRLERQAWYLCCCSRYAHTQLPRSQANSRFYLTAVEFFCGVFSPQLLDKIWDWPGDEAVLQVCTHTQFLPPTVP